MLGQKIQKCRLDKRLTQEQLGSFIGVGQSTIAMYENGHLMPPTKKILRLADVLDVPARDLFDCIVAQSSELTPVPA